VPPASNTPRNSALTRRTNGWRNFDKVCGPLLSWPAMAPGSSPVPGLCSLLFLCVGGCMTPCRLRSYVRLRGSPWSWGMGNNSVCGRLVQVRRPDPCPNRLHLLSLFFSLRVCKAFTLQIMCILVTTSSRPTSPPQPLTWPTDLAPNNRIWPRLAPPLRQATDKFSTR
jgi:hypothetical protein